MKYVQEHLADGNVPSRATLQGELSSRGTVLKFTKVHKPRHHDSLNSGRCDASHVVYHKRDVYLCRHPELFRQCAYYVTRFNPEML